MSKWLVNITKQQSKQKYNIQLLTEHTVQDHLVGAFYRLSGFQPDFFSPLTFVRLTDKVFGVKLAPSVEQNSPTK